MNVCIIGGGHIGTTLTCYIKHANPDKKVVLYTQHPQKFSQSIRCNDIEHELSYTVTPDHISNDPAIVSDADIIFIALPHFAVEEAFRRIAPHIASGVHIGILPGGGGCEFFFEKYFQRRAVLFGVQRVPFTAKLVEYGRETNLKSWKPYSVTGTLYAGDLEEACRRVEQCGLRTEKAPNYLSVALTPTNPLLHTCRTYEIFSTYERTHEFPSKEKFYVGWTDAASSMLLSMDAELHSLLDAVPEIDTTAIRPLSEHYQADSAEALTRKINRIPTFQSVWAPMRPSPHGNGTYVADVQSRLFTEDFPWGLAIIRAYFDLVDVPAPTMDCVLQWYAKYMGLSWYVDGVFRGHDLKTIGIPQHYGISTKADLLSFYSRGTRLPDA